MEERGWIKRSVGSSDPELLERYIGNLAIRLGGPGSQEVGIIARLVPRRIGAGRSNSLSGQFGLGPFPLHFDNSHWSVPSRYVILACVTTGACPAATFLLDSSDLKLSASEQKLILSAVFLIRNGRKSFYSSIRSSGRPFLRLDPGCMRALDGDGEIAMRLYSYEEQMEHVTRLSLRAGDVLAIDNWRTLHGRGDCRSVDEGRKLLRMVV